MSRSLFSSILFVLIAHAVVLGQPTSEWWYPYGTPEATRNNPAPTDSQQANDLKIKWRTSVLKNSPVTLVGGIRRKGGSKDRQVVGIESGTTSVIVLDSAGFPDTVLSLPQLAGLVRVALTGIFNSIAPSPTPTDADPNMIGIGIERERISDDPSDRYHGLLIDGDGNTTWLLGISDPTTDALDRRVMRNTGSGNRTVAVYPVAIFTRPGETNPVGYSVVSQDRYTVTPGDTAMQNGLRKYALLPQFDRIADLLWTYPIAPKAYVKAPAIFRDPASSNLHFALANEGYAGHASNFVTVPFGTQSTISSLGHIINIFDDFNALSVAPRAATITASGTRHPVISQFQTLIIDDAGTRRDVQVLSRTESSGSTFESRAYLYAATLPNNLGNFDLDVPAGTTWEFAAADLDGRAPGYPDLTTSSILVNNGGRELLASFSRPGEPEEATITYVLRWNNDHPLPDGDRAFYYVTAQQLAGRIVATGDLVADEHGREEIVVIRKNKLSILQMRPYDAPDFRKTPVTISRPFAEVYSETLDDSIVSVAIADLENDGENDVIVSTLRSTYAIGLPKQAFEIAVDGPAEFCQGEEIALRWQRLIGGGERGLDVVFLHEGTVAGSLQQTFGTESLVVSPDALGLEPGEYSVIVRDREFGHLADTSRDFSIVEREMSLVSGPVDGEVVALGTTITGEITTQCIDDPRLEVSVDGTVWEEIPGAVTNTGAGTFDFSTVASCSGAALCGADSVQEVFYRVVPQGVPGEASASFSVNVALPRAQVVVDSSLARLRTISWNERDFSCDTVGIAVSDDGGESWISLGEFATADESVQDLLFPPNIAGNVILCVRCAGQDDPGCIAGVARLTLSPFDPTNYVAPNPFDPTAPEVAGQGAAIVYSLSERGLVTITIYDAARSVVRRVVEEEQQDEGTYRAYWDGTNESGRTVANGPYICVIASSSGEQTILPIAVVIR